MTQNLLCISRDACARIDDLAVTALIAEVALYPKAGLVSLVDNGAHRDMDAATFLRSASALKGYFAAMARAGSEGGDFAALNAIGRAAEARMFAATGGINTHRGAVFSLGLLAAAAGVALAYGETSPEAVCRILAGRWGAAILSARTAPDRSHGAEVRSRYGAPGAREEAAAGFPTILLHTLPAFRATRENGGSHGEAALDAFYAGMAILEDNNLLYRAGPDGLAEAQELADAFLRAGGILAPGGFARAQALHRHFTTRRLSPGGSADLLAATLFLTAFEEAAWA